MDRLEHRRLTGVDVARRGDTDPALQHGPQVGDDVAKEVRGHDHVEPLRVFDHPHAARVDIRVIRLDLGKIFRHVRERACPDVMRADRVGLVDERDGRLRVAAAGPLGGQLERVTCGPFATLPRVDAIDQRYLVRRILL